MYSKQTVKVFLKQLEIVRLSVTRISWIGWICLIELIENSLDNDQWLDQRLTRYAQLTIDDLHHYIQI